MKKKLEDLQQLIKRNKEQKKPKSLNFPFLIIEPSSLNQTKLYLQMQSDFKKLCINSNHEMTLHGDLEVISMLNEKSDQ